MPDAAARAVPGFAHEAMSTVFEIFIAGKNKNYARQASREAFAEIDRIERLFSRFDPSSEICRISRLRPGESLRIGVETVECLTVAAQVQAETGGAFDANFWGTGVPLPSACKGIRIRKAGGAAQSVSRGRLPCLFDLMDLGRSGEGFEIIRIDRGPEKGEFPINLDLGGIGKGYALDKALEILRNWDVSNALLHAGTSTALAVGESPHPAAGGGGWPVGVAGGWSCRQAPKEIRLRQRALSGSGTEVKGQHVRDPRVRDGKPSHLAAWASHRSATAADALSTAFMIMSTSQVRAYCRLHPEVWALVIPSPKTCKIFNEDAIAR